VGGGGRSVRPSGGLRQLAGSAPAMKLAFGRLDAPANHTGCLPG
jgi:hypothetical protein